MMFKIDEKGAKGTIDAKNIAGELGELIQIINRVMPSNTRCTVT